MMTSEQPRVAMEGRYSVNDTCALLGIHRTTLYNYTAAGLIKCGFRRGTLRRFYKGAEILRFWKSEL